MLLSMILAVYMCKCDKEAKDGMSSRLVFLTICNDDHLIEVLMIPTQIYHSKVVVNSRCL